MLISRITILPLAALTALFSITTVSGAGSILGSAGDFTLLGGSAITATATAGTVISNGNIGLSPTATTAITGFAVGPGGGNAVIINGSIISTGLATAQARTDFTTAATGLAAMTPAANLTGHDMGGMTLLSGVYHFDDAAALTGSLILDAQGRNNAFWVFQIGTTLTTAAYSSITVINFGSNAGADLGLFWNVGAAISIGASNDLAGNYISGTSITLGNASSGSGRMLALAGISLDNNQLNTFGGPAGGDWTGGLAYNISGNVAAVPEPSAVLWLIPLGALGFAFWQRSARKGRDIILK